MGTYVAIRGWLEVEHEQRSAVQAVLDRHHHDLYSGGWAFPAKAFNWCLYVFFGGDLRLQAVEWLEQQVRELAALQPIDSDKDYPRGLFVVNNELGDSCLWAVREGGVTVEEMPSLSWLGE